MTAEHLFISYAYEDEDLAKWLALHLTRDGYRVWFDQYKLLGGESYPKDIEDAIKNHTFRMLHLVSRSSKDKPNPSKERTAGLNIARARGNDFLIPLNVDGLKPDELHWMTSDITFIPFHKNWADGYRRLLKKLVQLNTPRPLENNGSQIVSELMNKREKIIKKNEVVLTNRLPITRIPKKIKWVIFDRELTGKELGNLSTRWPYYKIDRRNLLSFQSPPVDILYIVTKVTEIDFQNKKDINNIQTENIVKSLLKNSIEIKYLENGMGRTKVDNYVKLFFPIGSLTNDKLFFTDYTGSRTYIKVIGERKRYLGFGKSTQYRYFISPKFNVKKLGEAEYVALIGTQIILTDSENSILPPRPALSARKQLCADWWNEEWLKRNLALASFLAKGTNEIVIGKEEEAVKIDPKFIEYISPLTIVENDETIKEEIEIREKLLQADESDGFEE